MSDHSTARLLFNLNSIISIIRRKAALETIANKIVADACKSYKFLERKSRAKMLLLSTNAALLLFSSIYISFALLAAAAVAESVIAFYTIY